MEKKSSESSSNRDMDCTNKSRDVWLVKIPKYIASKWSNAQGIPDAGRLKIARRKSGKTEITLTLNEEATKEPVDKTPIPKDHRLVISNITNQRLVVYSQMKEKLFLEGKVVQKGDCQPIADEKYMHLKRQSILKASQPARSVKKLDRIVQNYKPVSDHKHNVEYEQRKKSEGKKAREDKDRVQEMLFAAFEKHQYYNIKDLERITRQPVPYLKEILKEICVYNTKNPHRNMWELKPEYRHYKEPIEPK